ncbi:hypothetical protein C0J52_10673, partial [Blattella germanica]
SCISINLNFAHAHSLYDHIVLNMSLHDHVVLKIVDITCAVIIYGFVVTPTVHLNFQFCWNYFIISLIITSIKMNESTGSPYDINGQHFNPDMYLQKLLKECSLKQVMDQESEIVRDTQTLHSDMQTLVYENYNKFISATDTIRKMKSDFKKMEDEMDLLAANMDSITSFSEQISCTLQDTRQQITKLSGVHSLLKRLQFLFKLPANDELDSIALSQLGNFVLCNMDRYFNLVGKRVEREQEGGAGDTVVLVRALDRFHRRLQAMNTLFTYTDFARTGTEIVLRAGRRQCRHHLQTLKAHFADALTQVRQSLAAPKIINQDGDGSTSLSELLTSLVLATVEKVKGVLQDLLVFSQPDLTFGLKPHFREAFCIDNVREDLVVGFLHHLIATTRGFCGMGDAKSPPSLLLLLSKMCLEFETSSVHYLLSQTDEWFNIEGTGILTSEAELCSSMRATAQELLNHYVRMQGLSVSQVFLLLCLTTKCDNCGMFIYQMGQGMVGGSKGACVPANASVSRHVYRSNWSSYAPSQLDSSLVTNIQKLFSERIEIFSSVEFSKVSILTGIIKISLKTFLECVRLRTFSRYGLQQIQVDTHYLQLYLWRFVADEK